MDDGAISMSGFEMEGLKHAPDTLQGAIDSGDLAGGLTLIWRKGEIVQVAVRGKRDLASDAPVKRDTIFRIASMTKPITTVAALILMEEGKLSLNDPITKWAPEFATMRVMKNAEGALDDTVPAERDITIEDLMTHRSGLAYGFSAVGPIAHAYEAALGDILNGTMGPDEWLKALASLPLLHQPGDRFFYSVATDVLGFIVGRIAGTSFRDFLIERIFQPLRMIDTDFYIHPEKRDRAAVVYRMVEETGALEPVTFHRHDTAPAYCGGGGGLVSTADDYLRFARMLLNNGEVDDVRLLKAETVAMMRTNRLTDAQREIPFMGMPFWIGQGFGLGLSVILDAEKQAWMGAASDGSFGWPGAFGTWWQADPALDMILIYLVQNSMPLGPEAIANMGLSTRMGARLALPLWQKAVYAAAGA